MQLLPQSMFARLLWLLLGVLLLAQLLGAAIHYYDRISVLHEVLGQQAAERIAEVVRLLERLPPRDRRAALRALASPDFRVGLVRRGGQIAAAEPAPAAAMLAARLGRLLEPGRAVRVSVLEAGDAALAGDASRLGAQRRGFGPRHGMPVPVHMRAALRVEVQLDDGQLVRFDRPVPGALLDWPLRLLASLALLVLATVAVTLYAVRRLTRPLAALAEAADNLGKDIRAPALADAGPLEVRRAAGAFNTMQQRLQRYLDDRTAMLAAISHDLKTPLTRLRLRTELLQDRDLQGKFGRDLDDMQAMLEATLEFARGSSAEPAEAVRIDSLLEAVVNDYHDAGKPVSLDAACAVQLPVQQLTLRRCIANLVDNALRYAGSAEVNCALQGNSVVVRVLDRGPGVPEAQLEAVFEPFRRLESSRSRHTGGSGLGLAIARNIARGHGGDLLLANRAGGGLEARLTLPR